MIVAPIAAHEFLIKAIQKLYVVRTRKKNLFKRSEIRKEQDHHVKTTEVIN